MKYTIRFSLGVFYLKPRTLFSDEGPNIDFSKKRV